jgi:hypothetical protein
VLERVDHRCGWGLLPREQSTAIFPPAHRRSVGLSVMGWGSHVRGHGGRVGAESRHGSRVGTPNACCHHRHRRWHCSVITPARGLWDAQGGAGVPQRGPLRSLARTPPANPLRSSPGGEVGRPPLPHRPVSARTTASRARGAGEGVIVRTPAGHDARQGDRQSCAEDQQGWRSDPIGGTMPRHAFFATLPIPFPHGSVPVTG